MSINLDKIKAKLHALAQRTTQNGCTEAEAVAAMNKISELLSEYNLTMTEVELRDETVVEHKFGFQTSVQYVSGYVLTAIAKFCECQVWTNSKTEFSHTTRNQDGRPRKSRVQTGVTFFGLKQDTMMAEYLYHLLNTSVIAELARFKQSNAYTNSTSRKSASTSFEHGMNDRIYTRLIEMANERSAKTNISNNRALVIVKDQMIKEAFGRLKLKLNSIATTRRTSDYASFYKGQEAAQGVNLSRPVETSTTQPLRLTQAA